MLSRFAGFRRLVDPVSEKGGPSQIKVVPEKDEPSQSKLVRLLKASHEENIDSQREIAWYLERISKLEALNVLLQITVEEAKAAAEVANAAAAAAEVANAAAAKAAAAKDATILDLKSQLSVFEVANAAADASDGVANATCTVCGMVPARFHCDRCHVDLCSNTNCVCVRCAVEDAAAAKAAADAAAAKAAADAAAAKRPKCEADAPNAAAGAAPAKRPKCEADADKADEEVEAPRRTRKAVTTGTNIVPLNLEDVKTKWRIRRPLTPTLTSTGIKKHRSRKKDPDTTCKQKTPTVYSLFVAQCRNQWKENNTSGTQPEGGIMKHAARLWKTSCINVKSDYYDEAATVAFVALHQQRDAAAANAHQQQCRAQMQSNMAPTRLFLLWACDSDDTKHTGENCKLCREYKECNGVLPTHHVSAFQCRNCETRLLAEEIPGHDAATCVKNCARQHPKRKLETAEVDFGGALLLNFGSVLPAQETRTKRVKQEDGQ